MVIVDTEEQLNDLLIIMRTDDFVLDIVMSDGERHPCHNDISAIMFQFLDGDLWIVPMVHTECFLPFEMLSKWYADLTDELKLSIAKKYVFDKKSIVQLFKADYQFIDINIGSYLQTGEIIDVSDIKTSAHTFITSTFAKKPNLNRYIPLCKHAAVFQEKINRVDFLNMDISGKDFEFLNNVETNAFSQLESIGLCIDPIVFENSFGLDHAVDVSNRLVYSQYNFFTSTGRPSNRFGGINFAALNKENGSRASFVSRFGPEGMLVMMDYSAFHPRLIAKLSNYNLPMDVNPYEYFAKNIYAVERPTPPQIALSKGKFFQQLYGGIKSDLLEVPYFKAVQTYIDHRWNFFEANGYVETPVFHRKIKNCHIELPSANKLFNYILQAYETEVAVQTLGRILAYLNAKKTVPILYTYDSLLYDVHKSDGKEVLRDIKNIMVDNMFPVKVYVGKNYDDMVEIKSI